MPAAADGGIPAGISLRSSVCVAGGAFGSRQVRNNRWCSCGV